MAEKPRVKGEQESGERRRFVRARDSESDSDEIFPSYGDGNDTTTIVDYPWEEAAPGDPYAQDVRPGDVTVTPPFG